MLCCVLICTNLQAMSSFTLRPKSWFLSCCFLLCVYIFRWVCRIFLAILIKLLHGAFVCLPPTPRVNYNGAENDRCGLRLLCCCWHERCVLKPKPSGCMTLCVSSVGKVDFTTRILLVEQLWQSVYYTLYLKRQMICSLYLDYRHCKRNVINAASLNALMMIYIYPSGVSISFYADFRVQLKPYTTLKK